MELNDWSPFSLRVYHFVFSLLSRQSAVIDWLRSDALRTQRRDAAAALIQIAVRAWLVRARARRRRQQQLQQLEQLEHDESLAHAQSLADADSRALARVLDGGQGDGSDGGGTAIDIARLVAPGGEQVLTADSLRESREEAADAVEAASEWVLPHYPRVEVRSLPSPRALKSLLQSPRRANARSAQSSKSGPKSKSKAGSATGGDGNTATRQRSRGTRIKFAGFDDEPSNGDADLETNNDVGDCIVDVPPPTAPIASSLSSPSSAENAASEAASIRYLPELKTAARRIRQINRYALVSTYRSLAPIHSIRAQCVIFDGAVG